jgi:hypothetical protein
LVGAPDPLVDVTGTSPDFPTYTHSLDETQLTALIALTDDASDGDDFHDAPPSEVFRTGAAPPVRDDPAAEQLLPPTQETTSKVALP